MMEAAMPPLSSGLPGWQREEHSSTECLEITQLLELEDSLVFDSKIQDSTSTTSRIFQRAIQFTAVSRKYNKFPNFRTIFGNTQGKKNVFTKPSSKRSL